MRDYFCKLRLSGNAEVAFAEALALSRVAVAGGRARVDGAPRNETLRDVR